MPRADAREKQLVNAVCTAASLYAAQAGARRWFGLRRREVGGPTLYRSRDPSRASPHSAASAIPPRVITAGLTAAMICARA